MVNAFTDFDQSYILSKILPPETSDMWWQDLGGGTIPTFEIIGCNYPKDSVSPCWTLPGLFNALPKYKGRKYNLVITDEKTYIEFNDNELNIHEEYNGDTIIDMCYNMIVSLHERNLLYKQ